MYTKCNHCNKGYDVEDRYLGQEIECKFCKSTFIAIMCSPNHTIDVDDTEDNEVMNKKNQIGKGLQKILPKIHNSIEKNDNESNTRLVLDRIIQAVLGYKLEDIKVEQRIQGKKADYVLSANNEEVLVIEVKRVNLSLRDQHTFQATAYSAYSGIKWVLLTNAVEWRLYRVLTAGKIEDDLVFSIDLRNGIDKQVIQCFYLISKYGIVKKELLENLYLKTNALSNDSLINVILTDSVISKIKAVINKSNSCAVNDNEVRACIEQNLFQLE